MNQISREQLVQRADTTRSRLLTTVDELDRRRHELTNLMVQVKKAAVPVAIGAGIVVIAFAGALAWGISRARRTVARSAPASFFGTRTWSKPRQVKPAWYVNVAQSVLMAALSYVARQLAQQVSMIPRLAQGRPVGTHPLAKRPLSQSIPPT